MFEGKSQEELVTLTQRESMAVLIAKEPAAFLREEYVAMAPSDQPEETTIKQLNRRVKGSEKFWRVGVERSCNRVRSN